MAQALQGQGFDESKVRDAVKAALTDVEPMADLHASAEYRKRVAATLAVRAVADAFKDAMGRP